jgi:hypothetical protein
MLVSNLQPTRTSRPVLSTRKLGMMSRMATSSRTFYLLRRTLCLLRSLRIIIPYSGCRKTPAVHIAMRIANAHHRSPGPTVCIARVTITSMTLGKACLNLRMICCSLSKNKRSRCREICQAPHILTASFPSRYAFK